MKELLTLVGTRFLGIDAVKIVKAMKSGDAVQLVREPDNPHDPNAVRVLAAGPRLSNAHVGYVKGTEAAALAKWMDSHNWSSLWGNIKYMGSNQPMIEINGDG